MALSGFGEYSLPSLGPFLFRVLGVGYFVIRRIGQLSIGGQDHLVLSGGRFRVSVHSHETSQYFSVFKELGVFSRNFSLRVSAAGNRGPSPRGLAESPTTENDPYFLLLRTLVTVCSHEIGMLIQRWDGQPLLYDHPVEPPAKALSVKDECV